MKYLLGNWKMSLSIAESVQLAKEYAESFTSTAQCTVGFAPTAAALFPISHTIDISPNSSSVRLGAQNLHWEEKGACTGELSPVHLKECKGSFALAGHSEVRHQFGENDALVAKRVAGILKNGLMPVFCFGETLEERQSQKSNESIFRQMSAIKETVSASDASKILLAYEPVWAISGGNAAHKAATAEDVAAAHSFIHTTYRELFQTDSLGILYGGSANPSNCQELSKVPYVDGFLVGGASLKIETFKPLFESLT